MLKALEKSAHTSIVTSTLFIARMTSSQISNRTDVVECHLQKPDIGGAGTNSDNSLINEINCWSTILSNTLDRAGSMDIGR